MSDFLLLILGTTVNKGMCIERSHGVPLKGYTSKLRSVAHDSAPKKTCFSSNNINHFRVWIKIQSILEFQLRSNQHYEVIFWSLEQRFSTCGPRPTGGPRASAWWAATKVGN